MNFPAFREMPPPRMIRSGQTRRVDAVEVLVEQRRPLRRSDRPRRSRAPAEARVSASLPRISMWPSSRFGTRTPSTNSAEPIPVPRVSNRTTPLTPLPGAVAHLGDAGGVGVVQHHAGAPDRLGEQRLRRARRSSSGRCWRPSSPRPPTIAAGRPMPTGPAVGAEAGHQRRRWPRRRPSVSAGCGRRPRAPARPPAPRAAESTTPALMPDPADVDADQTPHDSATSLS